MMWENYSKIEGFDQDWNYQVSVKQSYLFCRHLLQGYERNIQDFFDFEGVFFFLLGILGGVLAVVLGLVLVQQGRVNLSFKTFLSSISSLIKDLCGVVNQDPKIIEPATFLQHSYQASQIFHMRR